MAICRECGKEFSARKNQLYCSTSCKFRHNNRLNRPRMEREERRCVHCGKSFETFRTSRKKFCSDLCQRLHADKDRRRNSESLVTGTRSDGGKYTVIVSEADRASYLSTPRSCPHCGKMFVPIKVTQYCCSSKCSEAELRHRRAMEKKLPVRTCEICGQTYQPRTKTQRFCSSICRTKHGFSVLKEKGGKRGSYVPLKDTVYECVICGKQFHPKIRNQKCCSPECSAINYGNIVRSYRKGSGETNPRMYKKTCIVCGKEFDAVRSSDKYCSPECNHMAGKIQRDNMFLKKYGRRICVECGKEFVPEKPMQTCCSPECSKSRVERFGKGRRDVNSVRKEFGDSRRIDYILSQSKGRLSEGLSMFDRMLKMDPEEFRKAYDLLSPGEKLEFRTFYKQTYGVKTTGIQFIENDGTNTLFTSIISAMNDGHITSARRNRAVCSPKETHEETNDESTVGFEDELAVMVSNMED